MVLLYFQKQKQHSYKKFTSTHERSVSGDLGTESWEVDLSILLFWWSSWATNWGRIRFLCKTISTNSGRNDALFSSWIIRATLFILVLLDVSGWDRLCKFILSVCVLLLASIQHSLLLLVFLLSRRLVESIAHPHHWSRPIRLAIDIFTRRVWRHIEKIAATLMQLAIVKSRLTS